MMWPDRRLCELFGTELPIVQAPMAAAMDADMVIAVAKAGGLGSLPCAMMASAPRSASQTASSTTVAEAITTTPAAFTRRSSASSGKPK